MDWALLGWTTLAFALAMGVGAHALDEMRGRPLQTRIPPRTLATLAVVSISAACAIGIAIAVSRTLWLLAFVAVGAFLVVAYNLELFGGRFHGGLWFPAAWGAFPVLTAYFAQAGTIRTEAIVAAAFATAMTTVQRTLSTPVRHARRTLGTTESVHAMERSLRILTWANVLLGCAVVLARLT